MTEDTTPYESALDGEPHPCWYCQKPFEKHVGIDFSGRPTGAAGPLFLCVNGDEGSTYRPYGPVSTSTREAETPEEEPLCECGHTNLDHVDVWPFLGDWHCKKCEGIEAGHPFRARPQEVDEGEWPAEVTDALGRAWYMAGAALMVAGRDGWTADLRAKADQAAEMVEQAIASRAAAEATEAAQLSCLEATGCSAVLRAERAERAAAEAEARAVEWEKAYRDRTVELTGAEEERDRLRAALEDMRAYALAGREEHRGTANAVERRDTAEWHWGMAHAFDMMHGRLSRALRESSEASQGER